MAVSVTDVERQAKQLLGMGAPVVASRKTPDVVTTAAIRAFPLRPLGNGCSAGLDVTDASGVGLAAVSGVAATDEGDPDSVPSGVTEPSGVTAESGDAVGLDDAPSDVAADGDGEPVGSPATAKGLATTLSASATAATLTAFLIRPNGERG